MTQINNYFSGSCDYPEISIYFSAFNEEENVVDRMRNIISQNYPLNKIEIILISDGSTDKTVENAKKFINENPEHDISVIEFHQNMGKANSQNIAAREAKYEIIISTDAETRFLEGCLKHLVTPFNFPEVGVVGGTGIYLDKGIQQAKTYSKYRSLEYRLRDYEQQLGVMTKTDAYCVAYRKCIWEPIEKFEDVDQVITLFATKKGFISLHSNLALCTEIPNTHWRQELKQRSRMTRKAMLSICNRWRIKEVIKFPFFSIAIFSHKIIRFLSPLWVISLIVGIFSKLYQHAMLYSLLYFLIAAIFLFIINKYVIQNQKISKAFEIMFAFSLANIGFALGLINWLLGDKSGKYALTRNLKS